MNDFFSRLVLHIKSFLSDARNYGCLPDASGDAQPADKIQTADPSFPKSANPVEKGRSLL
jgi:hypothetical protein